MTERKQEIALIVTLTISSTFYAGVTMLYCETNEYWGLMKNKTSVNGQIHIALVKNCGSYGIFGVGCCISPFFISIRTLTLTSFMFHFAQSNQYIAVGQTFRFFCNTEKN